MDAITSPLVTVVLNLVASVLVSKGILDSKSSVAFVQLGNSVIVGITTALVAIWSIYKMVDLKKHQISANTQIVKNGQVVTISQPASKGQSGLPVS